MIFNVKKFMSDYDLKRKDVIKLIGCTYSNLCNKMTYSKVTSEDTDKLDNFIESYKKQK